MTSIGTVDYSNSISRALVSGSSKSTGTVSTGTFGSTIINLTTDVLAHRSEVQERARQKSETGERWTDNSLFKTDLNSRIGYIVNKDAIDKVREKLREEGVDPSKRTPTHKITDEQMAQLAEKYDFEYLSFAGMDDPEYGNFLLDLAYMNVFSCDELENEFFGVSEINSSNLGWLECICTFDGSEPYFVNQKGEIFYSYEDMFISNIMDYLRTKYPGRTEDYYLAKYEDYTAKKDERISVIHDFFDRASKYYDYGFTNTVKPIIEDATEKLKEDFGGKL